MAAHAAHAIAHEEKPGFWRKYVFSVDHKVIGKQYMFLALFMALVGGALAYMLRWQIAWPETAVPGFGWIPEPTAFGGIIPPEFYNAIVTMHGTIMVFFVAMPLLLGALGNFLIPLMIGAPDMAFPRLNMMSFWTIFTASLVMLASFFVPQGAAAAGWTGYAPLSSSAAYSGVNWGQTLWILGLALEFASFLMGGVNFLTTTITMRAPGMSLFRLPLMVWMQNLAALIFMLSVGPLIAGAVLLLLDQTAGTGFFSPAQGGDPLLWQHLFWFFGHPEVYVILLPGIGAILEIMPVFARKPIFGYRPIVYSTIVAAALSFIVWAHHMFTSGMNFKLAMPFSITTILISVPFTLIVLSMIATLWKGAMRFPTPMMFAVGTLAVFIVGGVTGIFLGSAPTDIYLHDTSFVVAHFHFTLFSATIFGGFAGLYFWFPKMFGRMMNETLGKIHFWFTLVCFNLVFIPMFGVGLGGQMRRLYDPTQYDFLKPQQPLNQFITIAAMVLFAAQLAFIVNFFWSMFKGKLAGNNPWQANTLEWSAPSPPPHGNFETAPAVYHGPYVYSAPNVQEDWTPQNQPA
jgi:cytochrome c oxidase subunit 1